MPNLARSPIPVTSPLISSAGPIPAGPIIYIMAGGGFFVPGSGDEENDGTTAGEGAHAVQWVGKAGVRGPRWARMPLLTAGMLGIQCVWSIEMGYGKSSFAPIDQKMKPNELITSSISIPARPRPVKIPHVPGLHGWTTIRIDRPTPHWDICRPIQIAMGSKKTVHDSRNNHLCGSDDDSWLGSRIIIFVQRWSEYSNRICCARYLLDRLLDQCGHVDR